ncbi:polysaccharide lyase family 14 protein [Phlebiopsis gigantea 11061_1 CR5-6]|uniref:Polysaccharide lyase family 14 protein n=1 Tax=Phlebiopsis gigantea (strain 11061_1 CR5-6) TaxID=745531 RepID=A0A0C3SAZ5_PHLG1|nr:polysaccharide lyase family 14 protein [Phlebiopsis gigantea 11061_1 CR5-6]
MQIVQGIPAAASATTAEALVVASSVPDAPPTTAPTWDNASSIMQLFYPAGSVNPTSDPQGGADFYATPLDLADAQNVSLAYSVFFPSDFDWVLAGKLPGIYGGHKTCSGGDDALSCFSTRLMWREGGAGELYLYAPKDKQTDALCSTSPMSVCDQAYGLSIGRGAFNFTPGAWTHVKQTVTLNTPGEQDGSFVLEVDGRETMRLADVYYRGALMLPYSSFFGGHEEQYATPRDQYTWFKDFAMAINA